MLKSDEVSTHKVFMGVTLLERGEEHLTFSLVISLLLLSSLLLLPLLTVILQLLLCGKKSLSLIQTFYLEALVVGE